LLNDPFSDSIEGSTSRLLREFGSVLVTDLRSESRGCPMSDWLEAPETDRISA